MKKIATLFMSVIMMTACSFAQKPAQGAAEGQPAPDFVLPDAAGKDVALSSLQGKWVVLDFWGSWCPWCIKGFPQMKEYFGKYGKDVYFVGVACGDKKATWEASLKKYELPWINLWNNPEGDNTILKEYGIQGFPTKLIIDPKGVVRNITIGEDPEFYNVLTKLLSEKK